MLCVCMLLRRSSLRLIDKLLIVFNDCMHTNKRLFITRSVERYFYAWSYLYIELHLILFIQWATPHLILIMSYASSYLYNELRLILFLQWITPHLIYTMCYASSYFYNELLLTLYIQCATSHLIYTMSYASPY